jgi:hypothetical protein
MSFSTVNVYLTNASTFTVTYGGGADWADVAQFAQSIVKNNGVWNGQKFYPATAIASIEVS